MTVSSWSHSKYADFIKCKRMFWLKHDQKVAEPERMLRPGQTEHANDRGSRVHDSAEQFVRGKGPMIPEMRKFAEEFEVLKREFTAGHVSLEGEWGVNRDWEETGWNGEWVESGFPHTGTAKKLPARGREGDIIKVGKLTYEWVPAWLRLKLDALVFLSPEEVVVIDYKTGKRFGNEIKHTEQVQLYALNTLLRFPEVEQVDTELWYLDVNEISRVTYTRDQGMRFKRSWDKHGSDITSCRAFPPNANVFSCQWCGYGPWGTGDCPDGVRR